MIRGTWITLGDRKLLLPPANWATQDKHTDFFKTAMTGTVDTTKLSGDEMSVMADIILLSLQRNYPDLTREQFFEDLDFGNVQELFMAVLKTSGFEEAKPGEAVAASSQTSTA